MDAHHLAAPLPPEAYWKPEWLEQEQNRVFSRHWNFAGFTQDLHNHNDYISFTIGGAPAVVRNTRGKLAAFRNICSHRHSLIHPEGCGNGMFRCPFHGWTYDGEGVPVGIPSNTAAFGFDTQDRRALALETLAVECCGSFVFVRQAAEGPSLAEWLGPLAEKLESAAKAFPVLYGKNHEEWACNWKWGVEVTLEGYHVGAVHPTTFALYAGREDARDFYGRSEYAGFHSWNTAPLSEPMADRLKACGRDLRLPRSTEADDYEHYLIYPNFLVGISAGLNVCATRYEPRAPGLTRMQAWLLTGAPAAPEILGSPAWRQALNQWHQLTFTVLAEDRGACETVQAGVRHARQRGMLGAGEERVRHFQSALLKDLRDE